MFENRHPDCDGDEHERIDRDGAEDAEPQWLAGSHVQEQGGHHGDEVEACGGAGSCSQPFQPEAVLPARPPEARNERYRTPTMLIGIKTMVRKTPGTNGRSASSPRGFLMSG